MATGTALQPQKKSRHSHYLLAGVLILVALVQGWVLGGGNKVKEGAAYVVGLEEYVYGYPPVMMDVTREVLTAASTGGQCSAPINQFARIRTFVDPDFKNVVRISVNSLWSHGFLDLDQEPTVVSTPDMDGRYIVVQGLNMWTGNFMSAGTRTNGGKAANYLISDPNCDGPIPKDVDHSFKLTTRYAWVLVRMSAATPADFPAIHAKQDQSKITPLSAWGKPCTSPATAPLNPNVDFTATPSVPPDLRRGVFRSANTHTGRQSSLHSIQRAEDAVFHSSERLLQPPLERADAGPRPKI